MSCQLVVWMVLFHLVDEDELGPVGIYSSYRRALVGLRREVGRERFSELEHTPYSDTWHAFWAEDRNSVVAEIMTWTVDELPPRVEERV